MTPTVTLDVYGCARETDLARLYSFSDDPFDPEARWVPKSLIEDEEGDGHGWIDVPEWWAEQEGLI